MKAKLYATESGWDTLHAKLCDHVGIPTDTTTAYAKKFQVREGHADAGKWVMKVLDHGRWKADDVVSGLVDYDEDWQEQPEE